MPCCRYDARSTVRLTTDNSQHRRNGREPISLLRRRAFRVHAMRKLTLRSVASVQGLAPKRGGESASRRLEFHKGSQLFIRVHNETFSVTAMCVSNPDRSPVGINR